MKLTLGLIFLFSLPVFAVDHVYERRLEIFDRLVQEIIRLDGEALGFRDKGRPEKFAKTVARLRGELGEAKHRSQMGQIFRRLDATYPNSHARVFLADSLWPDSTRRAPLPVRIVPAAVKQGQKHFEFMVGGVELERFQGPKAEQVPAVGDLILEIQGNVTGGLYQDFKNFCKYPMFEQCALAFHRDALTKGIMVPFSETITLKLKRQGRVFETTLPWSKAGKEALPVALGPSLCEEQAKEHPGWVARHQGLNICLLKNPKYPSTFLLRIRSFAYRRLDPKEKIQSLSDEVQHFVDSFWRKHAPNVDKLIIDLQYNGGGDVPVPWYKIFLPFPFQEQYYQQKNISELADAGIRENLFYSDPNKEVWYQELVKKKGLASLKPGDFLPVIPQFCAEEMSSRPCGKESYQGQEFGFKGKIAVLVDEDCNSTCSGVVWQLKDKLKKRVITIGVPDTGDTNYARVYIDVYEKAEAPFYEFKVLGRKGGSKNEPGKAHEPLIRQVVSVTRTTDSKGRILSNVPNPVDIWIAPEPLLRQSYTERLLAAALKI